VVDLVTVTTTSGGTVEMVIPPAPSVTVAIPQGQAPIIVSGSSGSAPTALGHLYEAPTPAQTWIITHALTFRPNVAIVDSAGTLVHGSVQYDSDTQITVTFAGAFSGKAYLS